MKRILPILLCCALLIGVIAVPAMAASFFSYYQLDSFQTGISTESVDGVTKVNTFFDIPVSALDSPSYVCSGNDGEFVEALGEGTSFSLSWITHDVLEITWSPFAGNYIKIPSSYTGVSLCFEPEFVSFLNDNIYDIIPEDCYFNILYFDSNYELLATQERAGSLVNFWFGIAESTDSVPDLRTVDFVLNPYPRSIFFQIEFCYKLDLLGPITDSVRIEFSSVSGHYQEDQTAFLAGILGDIDFGRDFDEFEQNIQDWVNNGYVPDGYDSIEDYLAAEGDLWDRLQYSLNQAIQMQNNAQADLLFGISGFYFLSAVINHFFDQLPFMQSIAMISFALGTVAVLLGIAITVGSRGGKISGKSSGKSSSKSSGKSSGKEK